MQHVRPSRALPPFQRRMMALAIPFAFATATLSPILIAPVHAQQSIATYNIPAGPLGPALNRFASEAGVLLAGDAQITEGKSTRGLRGQATPAQGFARLLEGTQLEAIQLAGGDFSLRRAISSGAGETQLPAVNVTAQQVSGMDGYRAVSGNSASKMNVRTEEIPQSMSSIGAEQIRDQSASSVAEAVRYSAGVRPLDFGTTDDDISVRGFYLTGTGLYRDGMRLIQNGFMTNIEPYGLERMDIVHGPASVLYGQAAPGGLLNAVTKRPTVDMRQEVGIEAGSHNRKQLTLDIGGALNNDASLLGRLTVLHRESDTQWDFLNNDRTYIAPALTWRGRDTSMTVMAQYQDDRTGFIIPYYRITPSGPANENINVNGPDSGHQKRSHSIGYAFEHRFNDLFSFRQNFRYLDGENTRREMRNRGLGADQRSITRLAMYRPDSEETWVIDNQLEINTKTDNFSYQGVVGVDYYRSRLNLMIHSLNGAVLPVDMINPVYVVPNWNDNFLSDATIARTEQTGIYSQNQFKFADRWVLSVGGRYDSAKTHSAYSIRATSAAPFTTTNHQRNDDAFTGRLGAVYLGANGLSPYISYSTAFQPTLTTTTTRDVNGSEFKPEKGKQVEAGIRYIPVHGNYSLSAAIFELTKSNVRTPSNIVLNREVQTGEIRTRGLELQGNGRLTSTLSVIGAYTYLDAEITKDNEAVKLGKRPGNTPKHVASIWGKYKKDAIELGVGARYISATAGDVYVDNDGRTPRNDGYTLLDAMAGYEFDRNWRLALNVTNLLDKTYTTQCTVMRFGDAFCAIGYERNIRLNLSYRF